MDMKQKDRGRKRPMPAYTYASHGKFELKERPIPVLLHDRDAVVRVTLNSICTKEL